MTQAMGSHPCEGIGCEYCAAVDAVLAGERELARKANRKPASRTRRSKPVPRISTTRIEVDGTPDEINVTIDKANRLDQAVLTEPTGEPFVAAPGNLGTAAAAYKFILGGNAYFTIRSLKTGTRYTYRVNLPKKDPKVQCSWCRRTPCQCSPAYFVALLTGPNNTGDYTYLGMVKDNQFRLTKNSKMNADSKPVIAFRWVFERIARHEMPPQTEIWHEGRCGVCGRPLTVPESIASGIGPVCEAGGL